MMRRVCTLIYFVIFLFCVFLVVRYIHSREGCRVEIEMSSKLFVDRYRNLVKNDARVSPYINLEGWSQSNKDEKFYGCRFGFDDGVDIEVLRYWENDFRDQFEKNFNKSTHVKCEHFIKSNSQGHELSMALRVK